jgi:CheY-like chemotaxis protein
VNVQSTVPQEPLTILVAEDEQIVRQLVCRILLRLGYRVIEAVDGCDALEKLKHGTGDRIDLLFTDLMMPQMDGRELARKVSEHDPRIRVLFTSGSYDSAAEFSDCAPWFLPKPYTSGQLKQKLGAILSA